MASRYTWGFLYFLLFGYRSVFSVLDQFVILDLTNVGDTLDYQKPRSLGEAFSRVEDSARDGWYQSVLSAAITRLIGWTFAHIGLESPLAANLGFQGLAFIGIVYFLSRLPPTQRAVAFPFMFFPSFTVWTSMATKEAMVVMLLGLICGQVAGMIHSGRRPGVVLVGALAGLFVYKPHYLAAVLFVVLVFWLGRSVREKTTMALMTLAVAVAVVIVLSESLGQLGVGVSRDIHSDIGNILLKRPQFIVEPRDVFVKAPLGMWLSFTGPTLTEAGLGVLQAVSFAESLILVGVLLFVILRHLFSMPLFSLLVGAFAAFLILFATYPLGTSNPGTAIRYRAGYWLFIVLVVCVVMTRQAYVRWIAASKGDEARTIAS
jgi:hypothetical protein